MARRLAERTIAVLGFGNQGEAHALNLRDAGSEVAAVKCIRFLSS